MYNLCFIVVSQVMVYFAHIEGLTQDCSNSSALAMELLQFCAKPSINPLGSLH